MHPCNNGACTNLAEDGDSWCETCWAKARTADRRIKLIKDDVGRWCLAVECDDGEYRRCTGWHMSEAEAWADLYKKGE